METPTAFPLCISRNYEERPVPSGGSSAATCEKAEVLEISPPAMNHSSQPKCPEHKEIPEIIDVDDIEDCDNASLMDTEVDANAKGKKVLADSSVGVGGSADEEFGDDIAASNDGAADIEDSDDSASELDDLNEDSDLYFGEDEWIDADYENMIFDDNDHLEAHFDNMELPPGVEAPIPWFRDTPKNEVKGPSTSTLSGNSLRIGQKKVLDEIIKKFETFAKFDTVEDCTDHYYSQNNSSALASKEWSKRIQEEWKILEKNLPAEVYVRAYESRMDLLRAVIIGAEGTPYHDGLFFFDVQFPSTYPQIPPEVYYHSGGLRINPNLYKSGKVCLSLLNTWSGRSDEKWIPKESTILQVLVSIQGLILNAKPFYNEPGYEGQKGTIQGEHNSSAYNENIFMYSLKTMVYSIQKPPKHFENFVVGYFRKNARYILVSCVAYLNGAKVGCLVRGGIRDFEKINEESCSDQLKKDLGQYITLLVRTFMEIGADGCQDFLDSVTKESKAEVTS